jgi:hypothetical protein
MLGFIAGVLLAAGAVWLVLAPILRPAPAREAGTAADDFGDPDDDLSPRAVALRALKEIEFDRATGKLSDTDYESLKAQYTQAALSALRSESAGGRDTGSPAPIPRPSGSPLGHPSSPILSIGAACPAHGPRPEAGALFCSTCGRRLAEAPGFCGHCGRPLESGSRFCARCGRRVAA